MDAAKLLTRPAAKDRFAPRNARGQKTKNPQLAGFLI
ncbi:MAG: hypothetical protein JWP94_2191 [Mucilaginibacter sp.]|nr:hypothetical protein [Mucilaginibacter sp.]